MGMDDNLMYEAVEEADVFYDEIKRQILLLTADDDEDFFQPRYPNSIANTRQRLQRSMALTTQPAGSYFSCWVTQSGSSTPFWLVNLWRNGKGGTGVFIPHIVKSRRTHRSGKKKNGTGRICKQIENKQS